MEYLRIYIVCWNGILKINYSTNMCWNVQGTTSIKRCYQAS
jgi:predicted phage tail protein